MKKTKSQGIRNRLIMGFVLLLLSIACSVKDQDRSSEPSYLRWVGDIEADQSIDLGFTTCNPDSIIVQYFHFDDRVVYEGEKSALNKIFFDRYQAVTSNESGLIRIRFVVNCEGKTGRFRMIEMDESYQERPFDKQITDQLMLITKELDGWLPMSYHEHPSDYYMYLIFKIKEGKLIEIMP